MRIVRFLLPGLVVGAVLAAGVALAQTPLPDPLDRRDAKRLDGMEKVVRELRSIVFKGRDTGVPVVVQPADTDARMQELGARVQDLEQTLRRLNGTLETATHDLDQAKRENTALKAQVQTLTDRLGEAEKKLVAPPPATAEAAPGPAPTAAATPAEDPAVAFTRARQLMQAGDYDGAEAAFADYVEVYPDAPKTPEARYWWGKTLSVKGAHADAAKAYIGAIKGWPQTSWAPDAVVELSRSMVALKRTQEACQIVAELPKRYPKAAPNVTNRAAAVRTQAKCAA
jgi:tol-pal system protein YbgF